MAAIARGDEELVPAAFAKRLIAGESRVRVWRELRGLTQTELAAESGVNRVQIANIESGAKYDAGYPQPRRPACAGEGRGRRPGPNQALRSQ